MAEGTPRTWTLVRLVGDEAWCIASKVEPPTGDKKAVADDVVFCDEVVPVIEKEPVLELLQRCWRHEWKLPEQLWRDIDALLKDCGRLKADSDE